MYSSQPASVAHNHNTYLEGQMHDHNAAKAAAGQGHVPHFWPIAVGLVGRNGSCCASCGG